jgi:hypothetical protein
MSPSQYMTENTMQIVIISYMYLHWMQLCSSSEVRWTHHIEVSHLDKSYKLYALQNHSRKLKDNFLAMITWNLFERNS